MSESIKLIRGLIEGRIEALPDPFTKLDNKFDLEKNNFTNSTKKYGVVAKVGSGEDGHLNFFIASREFEITLCNRFVSTLSGDLKQEQVSDSLELQMEKILNDVIGLRYTNQDIILDVNYISNEEIDFEEIENLAILKFTILVRFKNTITGC